MPQRRQRSGGGADDDDDDDDESVGSETGSETGSEAAAESGQGGALEPEEQGQEKHEWEYHGSAAAGQQEQE